MSTDSLPCEVDDVDPDEPVVCRHCGVPVDEVAPSALAPHNSGACADTTRAVDVTVSTLAVAADRATRLSRAVHSTTTPARLVDLAADLERLATLLRYEAVRTP